MSDESRLCPIIICAGFCAFIGTIVALVVWAVHSGNGAFDDEWVKIDCLVVDVGTAADCTYSCDKWDTCTSGCQQNTTAMTFSYVLNGHACVAAPTNPIENSFGLGACNANGNDACSVSWLQGKGAWEAANATVPCYYKGTDTSTNCAQELAVADPNQGRMEVWCAMPSDPNDSALSHLCLAGYSRDCMLRDSRVLLALPVLLVLWSEQRHGNAHRLRLVAMLQGKRAGVEQCQRVPPAGIGAYLACAASHGLSLAPMCRALAACGRAARPYVYVGRSLPRSPHYHESPPPLHRGCSTCHGRASDSTVTQHRK